MNNKKKTLGSRSGLSLAEMMIAMVIAAVLLLTVGALSQISLRTQAKYYTDTQIHADISYGLKLIRNRVRASGFATDSPASPWMSDRILVDGGAFGIYQNTNSKDFVYVPDISGGSPQEVILSVPDADSINFTVTPEAAVPVRKITVRIDGEKKGIPFDVSTTVTKRGS